MKYVIIGGVAGGASAASRLRRMDEESDIILFEKGEYISYANCGLPYYIGNTIEERKSLFVQTPVSFGNRYNVDVRTQQEVTAINREKKTVSVRNLRNGKEYEESYDKLLLSPGANPIIPPLEGINLPNIFTLRNVDDCDRLKAQAITLQTNDAEAVIIGGGFIGLEMAENLHKIGYKVTVVEKAEHVLMPMDWPLAAMIQQHIQQQGIKLILHNGVAGFAQDNDKLKVMLEDGQSLTCNLVLLSIGVKPNTTLAQDCGLKIGTAKGIWVNKFMQTSDEDIYAVGDAVEFPHPLTDQPFCNFLAGPANSEARIAATNMIVPNSATYQGSISTAIAKVCDLTAAVTGFSEMSLQRLGIPYQTAIAHPAAHASYYPGGSQMTVKINFSPKTGMLLGAQIVGKLNVDKEIDSFSLIIKHKGTIYDLINSEHAYAPPFATAKSPVMFAGMVAENIISQRMIPIQYNELDDLLEDADRMKDTLIIDVREIQEFKTGSILGAVNYPVDEIREFLDDIPQDKNIVIFCEAGLRGYIASRILMQSGYQNVVNLIGGMKIYRLVGLHNIKS